MMIYLTGAGTSLAKSPNNPQSEVSKSLGGFISSTPVPNGAVNALFDLLSSYTLEKRQKETIALGVINQFPYAIKDVELKIVIHDDDDAIFKVAAVSVGSDFSMEQISSRNQEPMDAEFHDVSFYRAAVEIEITNPAIAGEEIAVYPFNVVVNVNEGGIEGTWNAFLEAFSNDDTYMISRVTETKFRIERQDETVLSEPLSCSYITTENFRAVFSGQFTNKADNSVLIKDEFASKAAVGIWIQRQIKSNKYANNEQLINEFKQKYIRKDLEEVELIISYNLVEG